MSQYSSTLKRYFEENDKIQETFEVTDREGTVHLIDKDVLLASILKLPVSDQKKIVDKITQIELRNPNQINHFLEYVAKGLVN
jgi:hypothetical protein